MSSNSEYGEELEEHAELFVSHNDLIMILEPQQEILLQFQQVGNNNNHGVQCGE